MKSTRTFFLLLTGVYVAAAIAGIALFHSPQYSRSYLEKYRAENERHKSILKNPAYQLYRERPALHPLTGKLAEDAAFVEAYESRPEYHAEQRRMLGYVLWFKILNTGTVLAMVVRFGRQPLVKFLDNRIEQTRTEMDKAAQSLAGSEQVRAAAQSQLDSWPETEGKIRLRTERALEESLAEVRKQTQFARDQIARDIKSRKEAEMNAAIRALKEELVAQSIKELEERYKRTASTEQLAGNVNLFVNLMDHLS